MGGCCVDGILIGALRFLGSDLPRSGGCVVLIDEDEVCFGSCSSDWVCFGSCSSDWNLSFN